MLEKTIKQIEEDCIKLTRNFVGKKSDAEEQVRILAHSTEQMLNDMNDGVRYEVEGKLLAGSNIDLNVTGYRDCITLKIELD